MFSLESPHRGDSYQYTQHTINNKYTQHTNKYTQHTIMNEKRKSPEMIPNTIMSSGMFFFFFFFVLLQAVHHF